MSGILAPELESPSDLAAPDVGAGARFFVYISPQNETEKRLSDWSVTLTHEGSNWTGTITSRDPHANLQTPKLSGHFKVRAKGAIGPKIGEQALKPKPPSTDTIGCNQNCTSFVGLIAAPDGLSASYWTVWDAVCKSGS